MVRCTKRWNNGRSLRDNGDDVICTYAKEYSELTEGIREKGTIQREDSDDEESRLEVSWHF